MIFILFPCGKVPFVAQTGHMKLRKTRLVKSRVDDNMWKKLLKVCRQEKVDQSDVVRSALDQLFSTRAIR